MAKITDPDQLNIGTEMSLNTGTREISLNVAGNLVAKDGVTLQALYSKLEELWTSDTYNNHPFPMYAIDYLSGQFYFGYDGVSYNGWKLANDTMRTYIRDGGWSEYNSSGTLTAQYCCFYGLGTLESSGTQLYYQIGSSSGTATDFTYTDMPNAAIKVYDSTGPVDNRSYAKVYDRPAGYVYSSATLSDTRATTTGAYIVAFPLTDRADTHITANDATVAASSPYTGVTATWLTGNGFSNASVGSLVANDVRKDTAGRWFICTSPGTIDAAGVANYTLNGGSATLASYSGERLINGTYCAFNIIVDGNSTDYEKIYTKVQYLLRQAGDIDSGSGTHLGKVTDALMNFSGSTLTTTTGVYIDNHKSADNEFLYYTDVGGTLRNEPVSHNQSVTISGATAGSRIQIYDTTSSTELYNGTPTFPYTWTDASPYAADRAIRLRVAYVNGTTAKQFIETIIGTATELNYALSYLVAQEDDDVYINNAVDGSTVTNITINDGTMLLSINSATETWQNIYAYEMYWLFTSTGIQDLGQSITAPDPANYLMDSTVLTIKNISGSATKLTGGWGRDPNTSDTMDIIDLTGDPIFTNPPHVVAYSASGSSTESDYLSIDDYNIPL